MIAPPDDLALLRVPTDVRAAGGLLLGAGGLAVLVVVQTLTGFRARALVLFLLLGLAGLGIATAFFGLGTLRGRLARQRGGVVASGMLAVASLGWLVLSFTNGLVSLFGLGLPLLTIGALLATIVSLRSCARVEEARARLRADGLDLGT